MKRKILIGLIAGLFVVVTMLNLKINTQSNDNISLKNIVALTTANAEFDYSVPCNRYYHGPWCGARYTQEGYDIFYSAAGYF